MHKSLPRRGKEKGMSGSENSVGKGLETGSGVRKKFGVARAQGVWWICGKRRSLKMKL